MRRPEGRHRPVPEDPVRAPADGPPIGRLLREAEKEMTRLGRQRDKLHDALVSTTDHVELTRLGAELRSVQDELDAVEERWLALAEGLRGTELTARRVTPRRNDRRVG